ncbi:MAG: (d)CMP kinase, partial [Clostridia bacterium]|nr:(d)CMP kinase [Clostridia bacterium]
YRAMALKALQKDISPKEVPAVLSLLEQTEIFVRSVKGVQHTYLDGEDVSERIRTQEVAKGASDISAIPGIRIKLAEAQRCIARENDVVLDGREIGSYVLPDAAYKFFITASAETRATRRLDELKAKGQCADLSAKEMERQILQRDHNDCTRAFAPLIQVPEAIYIDTTDMTLEQAVAAVLSHLPTRLGEER